MITYLFIYCWVKIWSYVSVTVPIISDLISKRIFVISLRFFLPVFSIVILFFFIISSPLTRVASADDLIIPSHEEYWTPRVQLSTEDGPCNATFNYQKTEDFSPLSINETIIYDGYDLHNHYADGEYQNTGTVIAKSFITSDEIFGSGFLSIDRQSYGCLGGQIAYKYTVIIPEGTELHVHAELTADIVTPDITYFHFVAGIGSFPCLEHIDSSDRRVGVNINPNIPRDQQELRLIKKLIFDEVCTISKTRSYIISAGAGIPFSDIGGGVFIPHIEVAFEYSIKAKPKPISSILFREGKDGFWGDEIPGFDHVGFHIEDQVYESHPGYSEGTYVSANGEESISIIQSDGVQSQHSRATFKHDSMDINFTPVIDFEEIEIPKQLAIKMRDSIETVQGANFQYYDRDSLDGIVSTLSPSAQKGGDNSFTCVGLVEWAAEKAVHNGGHGFIKNSFESFSVSDPRGITPPPGFIEVPLLSPELLNFAMKSDKNLQNSQQWIQGFFDPVDFILTDPLGRKLGFNRSNGHLNEIPNSFYSGNGGVEQFLIPNPIPGTYTVELEGIDEDVFAAIGTNGASTSFYGFLSNGEKEVKELFVEPKPGTSGDVNGDGEVDDKDIQALIPQLNRHADGPGDPGDLDGDGLLSDSDLDLLYELVDQLSDVNTPPLADAGTDQIAESTSPDGALVTLDGTGSTDPDGDQLTYTWEGPFGVLMGEMVDVTLPLGTHTITLTVDDGNGGTDSDTVEVVVDDTTPPDAQAELVPVKGGDDDQRLRVQFSCSDDCDPNVKTKAWLKAGKKKIPVENGQEIEFERDGEVEIDNEDGVLEIEAPFLHLIVECEDASGNTSEAVAEAPAGGDDDGDDDDDDDDDDDGDDD